MKIPLRYQMSEYDCGPTALLNAVSYLFPRSEVPPEIIRSVMLYTLDCYGMDGTACKAGTSRMAMMYLANWLEGFSRATQFPLTCQYLSGRAVHIGAHSHINDTLVRGGVAVVRLFYEVEHYAFGCFNRETRELYAFGAMESREAVVLFDERTRRTADDTIEYFI